MHPVVISDTARPIGWWHHPGTRRSFRLARVDRRSARVDGRSARLDGPSARVDGKDTLTAIFGTSPGSLSDLEVISQLGRGADTVVYRVRRRGGEYTLKVLTSADAASLTAVRREAALLGSVGHPLLPRIFEVGLTSTGPYLILEYIDGQPPSQSP